MRALPILLLTTAVVIAGGTAILVKQSLETTLSRRAASAPNAPAAPTNTAVLVAARELPPGTILKPGDLRWQPWPDGKAPAKAVVRTSAGEPAVDFTGAVARRGILAEEPITPDKVFHRKDAGFLAGALTPGRRAMSVSVTPTTGSSGFILPGDRVDVIVTVDLSRQRTGNENLPAKIASETILRDIPVLAIDQKIEAKEETAQVGKTVTLEVTPSDAEILATAAQMGQISLSLRSLTRPTEEAAERYPIVTTDHTVLRGLNGLSKPAAPATGTTAPAAARSAYTVTVHRATEAKVVEVPH